MDFSGACVDWLTIREPNEGQFEPLNDGYVIVIDADGVERYTTSRSLKLEGSFSSSCQVRVTEREREISFNPSRWNRAENVFGVDFAQAVARANDVFGSFGQVPLEPGECRQTSDGGFCYTGAVVTRVDIAWNLKTGSAAALSDYFWHVSGLKLDRVETRRKRNTVYFGRDARKRVAKVYLKHVELRERNGADQDDYVLAVADWCERVGVARIEVRYGRDFLRSNGLRGLGNVTQDKLIAQFQEDVQPMLEEFDDLNLSELSNAELGCFLAYVQGMDVKERYKQSMFYQHRKRIKEVTGYDIANDNVTRLEPKARKIVLEAAEPPDFYRMPEEA